MPMTGPSVEIVDFEPGLASAFYELNVEWLDRYFEVEPVDERMLRDPEATIVRGGGQILFAILGGETVGTAALMHHGDGIFELTKMAVTERCQGRGIGRQLLDACLRRFAEAAGRRLYLESHSSLETALRLYESAGFQHSEPPAPSAYRRADVYMVYRPDRMAEKSMD